MGFAVYMGEAVCTVTAKNIDKSIARGSVIVTGKENKVFRGLREPGTMSEGKPIFKNKRYLQNPTFKTYP